MEAMTIETAIEAEAFERKIKAAFLRGERLSDEVCRERWHYTSFRSRLTAIRMQLELTFENVPNRTHKGTHKEWFMTPEQIERYNNRKQ